MSYLVLARKYRPKTFSEVVGQEHVTRTLANAFAKDRVHHAFLFCGPRGVGKTTLARILGKALNCEQGPTSTPCGTCSACVTITNGTSVDYFEMDGASNRGIDSIRELTDAVRYQPAVLRKKVYVIDEVHMLTTEAFNALLKTLEEPPPHVSFVLATTEPHKIPNTILSRCQRYDFKLVPAQRLVTHLQWIFDEEKLAAEPGAVSLIVRESGGSVRDSLSLCDQIISYVGAGGIREVDVAEVLGVADRSLTRSLVMSLATGDARSALEAVDAAVERGVDEVQLARAIVRYLRDLAVAQVAPDSETLVEGSEEERRELAEQAKSLDRSRVAQMFDRMVRACNDLGRTQQPRLVLDLALIDVAALEPIVPIADLLARLGELERGLGGGGPGGGWNGGSGGGRGRPAAPAGRPRSPGGGAGQRTASASSPPPPAPAPGPEAAGAGELSQAWAGARSSWTDSRPSPGNGASAAPAIAAAVVAEPPMQAAVAEIASAPAAAVPMPSPSPEPVPPIEATPAPVEATPAREQSAPPGPVVPSDMLGEWARMLDALGDARRALAGFYEHAKILSWDEKCVSVGFAPDLSYLFEMAVEKDNVTAMKDFLRQRYGRDIDLSVRMLTGAEIAQSASARSVLDMNRERDDAERQKRETEARAHPIYKKVLATFGRPVKEEIRTDV